MCCVVKSERGNGALEMILFLPLALFFLFVVTDAGLTYIEQGAVRDAVRSGLHHENRINAAIYRPYASGAETINHAELRRLCEELAEEVFNSLGRAKAPLGNSAEADYAVEVSAISLAVDGDRGVLEDTNYKILHTALLPESGFSSAGTADGYPYISREDFLVENLTEDQGQALSRFALPLGPRYAVHEPASARFLPEAIALYIEVRTLPSGINRPYIKSLLGRNYALQHQQLISPRSLTQ